MSRTDSEIYDAQERSQLISMCRANLSRLRESWWNDTAYETRFPELGYHKVEPGGWRILDIYNYDEGYPGVGPHYRTKVELLADLENYYTQTYARVSCGNGEV